MNVGHHSLEYWFHWKGRMPNTFISYNVAPKLRSRVSRSNAYLCSFKSLDFNLETKPCTLS